MCLGTKNLEHRGKAYFSISFSFPLVEGGPLVICLPAVPVVCAYGQQVAWLPLTSTSEKPQGRKREVCDVQRSGNPIRICHHPSRMLEGARGWDRVASGAQRGPSPEQYHMVLPEFRGKYSTRAPVQASELTNVRPSEGTVPLAVQPQSPGLERVCLD